MLRDVQTNEPIEGTDIPLQTYRFPDDLDNNDNSLLRLTSVNIEILRGSLVAVIGGVGSGKSSFMNALVGEMKCISGKLEFGGTMSYAPQTPWVMNLPIRDNILFGLPYDKEKYINVIEACALDVDFATFTAGDLTEVAYASSNMK
ncbi:hypothetical protein IW150_001418 [Coemansia sp. RSA 2607]|nr:hypothetical protein IW150_001418 [Coemansia sp. RSA 2607]